MNDKMIKDVEQVEDFLNDYSFSPKEFCKVMSTRTHRTIQQSFTRLCVEWLKTCASEDYRTDGRNEASHQVAKELLEGKDDITLPFI